MRAGYTFDPAFELTDEEKAIIASLNEEDERRKALGIPIDAPFDSPPTPRSDHEETDAMTGVGPHVVSASKLSQSQGGVYESLSNKQYVIDITDSDDPRPLDVRLRSLAAEQAADQRRLAQIAAVSMIPLMRAAESLPFLHHPNNIEETEEFDDGSQRTGLSSLLSRQPSFYHGGSSAIPDFQGPSTINPLLLLADSGSGFNSNSPNPRPLSAGVPVLRSGPRTSPDISRSSYGFIYNLEYDGLSNQVPEYSRQFCFQWVGETLRINGTLLFEYSMFINSTALENRYKACKVWFLSAMALFYPISPLDGSIEDPIPRDGNIFFYLIEKKFLGKPLFTTRNAHDGYEPLIYTINYDETKGDYYLLFYHFNLAAFSRGATPLTYNDMVNSKMEQSFLPIDTVVSVTFDATRDL